MMKTLVALAAFAVACQAADYNCTEVTKQTSGVCPTGTKMATGDTVARCWRDICATLSEWEIVRGTETQVQGPGYFPGCNVVKVSACVDETICEPTDQHETDCTVVKVYKNATCPTGQKLASGTVVARCYKEVCPSLGEYDIAHGESTQVMGPGYDHYDPTPGCSVANYVACPNEVACQPDHWN